MRIVLLVPLLLTACTGGHLYPDTASMNRTCPEVVQDSYKSLSRYNKRINWSTLTTIGVIGVSCGLTAGIACFLAGPTYYSLDYSLDPYGKKKAANEFNKDMRQGRDMKCTETWDD